MRGWGFVVVIISFVSLQSIAARSLLKPMTYALLLITTNDEIVHSSIHPLLLLSLFSACCNKTKNVAL